MEAQERLQRAEKMLKAAGVWYYNPTQEEQISYFMKECGMSEKEALINCEYDDELTATLCYLLEYTSLYFASIPRPILLHF